MKGADGVIFRSLFSMIDGYIKKRKPLLWIIVILL